MNHEIVPDVSAMSLKAVVLQRQSGKALRPISYASRVLTTVERRYSQIEPEALAILFAAQHFWNYLYGIMFVVTADHETLVSMFSSFNKELTLVLKDGSQGWCQAILKWNAEQVRKIPQII